MIVTTSDLEAVRHHSILQAAFVLFTSDASNKFEREAASNLLFAYDNANHARPLVMRSISIARLCILGARDAHVPVLMALFSMVLSRVVVTEDVPSYKAAVGELDWELEGV